MNLLALLILLPLLAAAVVAYAPAARARRVALAGTVAPLLACVWAMLWFDWSNAGAIQFAGSMRWVPAFGLELSVGVDSVAMLLIALTVLLGPICVLCSYSAITERVKTYYGWLLVLQAAMTGVFAARDLVLFYICFEFTLVPMYVLISLYGSTNRLKAATKFFLFTFTGSVITLAGLFFVAWFNADRTGVWTFDIGALQAVARDLPPTTQAWLLLALLAGFAVKVPLFPVHTWLPLAHTEAPTAGSVILAGVLLKLGTYGLFRFVLPFVPDAVVAYAPVIALVSIVGIVYAGLICWVQTDVKKLVAYSSVAHLGFCVLGLIALNAAGLAGSVMYMINHGLSTGALFLLVGMMYERYHTRSMDEVGGLASKMPIWATFMVFFVMASVGLPGLNGFVSEFLCLLGAFQAGDVWGDLPGAAGITLGPWFAAVAGSGMIVAAMYLLYMTGRMVFGELREPEGHEDGHSALPVDLNGREIGILAPLAAACIFLGVYPTPVLRALEPAVDETLRMVHGVEPERRVAGATVPARPIDAWPANGNAEGAEITRRPQREETGITRLDSASSALLCDRCVPPICVGVHCGRSEAIR
jgi:NADH-quinone oxidoreductase subunit M